MQRSHYIALVFFTVLLFGVLNSCKKEFTKDTPYPTTPYVFPSIRNFRTIPINTNNPVTMEGVELGKKLFFDPILSKDSSLSCSGCHIQSNSFSDSRIRSIGIDGLPGRRQAMALINLAWQKERFFWDGRATGLQAQALFPIQDTLEMHFTLPEAEQRLQQHPEYVEMFRKAFGTKTIKAELIGKALEQYEKTLISYNSKFDKFLRSELDLSPSEYNGMEIFKTEKGDCFHCHSTTAVEVFISPDRTFANNGLDSVASEYHFSDFGLGEFTQNLNDYGRFKIPTLRNLAFTAPYMHDGRFSTLDEVIDFYNNGPKGSPTLEPIMREEANKRLELYGHWGLNLTPQEKADLKAFLLTLTDSSFIQNP